MASTRFEGPAMKKEGGATPEMLAQRRKYLADSRTTKEARPMYLHIEVEVRGSVPGVASAGYLDLLLLQQNIEEMIQTNNRRKGLLHEVLVVSKVRNKGGES